MVKVRIPFVSAVMTIFFTACGGQLRYSMEEINRIQSIDNLREILFETGSGQQKALYYARQTGVPEKLVIIFPGIKSRALDWLDFAQHYQSHGVGFLLLDFPGRGESEGSLRPSLAWQSADSALEALEMKLNLDEDTLDDRLILIGHSFGTGAAMQYSTHQTPNQIILMAPFTKLRKLMVRRLGLLGWIVPNGMDNVDRIRELHRDHPEVPVNIYHGDRDTSIPVEMSRELAKLEGVTYHEVPAGNHVSILRTERKKLYRLISGD